MPQFDYHAKSEMVALEARFPPLLQQTENLLARKETKVTKGGSQRPTAKEERDINEICH